MVRILRTTLCVIIQKHNIKNTIYWTATTKNSADSSHQFVADAIRLFTGYVTVPLLKHMSENNIHLCAEMLSYQDQTHGAKVLKEGAIVTMVGTQCKSANKFVHYYTTRPEKRFPN